MAMLRKLWNQRLSNAVSETVERHPAPNPIINPWLMRKTHSESEIEERPRPAMISSNPSV